MRIAVAMLATSCTIHLRVSFFVMISLLSYADQLPVSKPPLPMLLPFLVNTLVAASLLSPFLMAIALTVAVSVRVIASLYRVLSALGAVPSVV